MVYAATPAAQPVAEPAAPFEEGKAPPVIDSHGGKLTPVSHGGLDLGAGLAVGLMLASPVAALIYGFNFSHRPPSAFRTACKIMSVGILAALTLLASALTPGPEYGRFLLLLLGLGYLLCAVGDAFLAGDPKRWLTPGLVAFLLGHLVFIGLFALSTGTQSFGLAVFGGMAATVLVGAAMLAWLWRSLGPMRWPVVAYVVVIVTMVCASLPHWSHNIAWPIGALLFMASDAILAGELFKGAKLPGPPRLTALAIWFLYYGAQLAFLAGMIGYVARY